MEWHGAYTVWWVIDERVRASIVVGSVREATETARYWRDRGAHSIEVRDSDGEEVQWR